MSEKNGRSWAQMIDNACVHRESDHMPEEDSKMWMMKVVRVRVVRVESSIVASQSVVGWSALGRSRDGETKVGLEMSRTVLFSLCKRSPTSLALVRPAPGGGRGRNFDALKTWMDAQAMDENGLRPKLHQLHSRRARAPRER